MPSSYIPVAIITLPPGAFIVLAFLAALQNKLKAPSATNKKDGFTCSGNCGNCFDSGCSIGKTDPKISISLPASPTSNEKTKEKENDSK